MRKDWGKRGVNDTLENGQKRIVLSVSYNGVFFQGWQSQENGLGVQDVLERAIKKITNENVRLFASGRTDTGVHAISQTCHFDTFSTIPSDRIKFAINTNIDSGVKVMESYEVDGTFHSRFSALAREYHYVIKEKDKCNVFDDKRVWGVKNVPDIHALNALAKKIEGEHNFSFLSLKEDNGKSKYRDIYKSEFYQENDRIVYRIIGNAFLYHQVRSIVGTIIKICLKGRDIELAIDNLKNIMKENKRSNAIFTAPPYGLYFYRTVYNETEWKNLARDIEGL